MVEDQQRRKPKFTQRVSLGLRVTAEVKERLDAAAERKGTSQSTEAAVRLEQSFDRESLLTEVLVLAYGRELAGILMMLGIAMEDVSNLFMDTTKRRHHSIPWTEHPVAYELAIRAAVTVLFALRPVGNVTHTNLMRQRYEGQSADILTELIHAVRRGDSKNPSFTTPPAPPWCDARTIRSLLGPIAGRARHPKFLAAERRTILPDKGRVLNDSVKAATYRAADAILTLINSSPRTPSRNELAQAIEKQFLPIDTSASQKEHKS